MKKWIPGVTLACSLALGQFAAAEHRNHRDAGHDGRHDNHGQEQQLSRQYSRYDRVVIGGYLQNVHDDGHYRRHHHGRWRDRHVHDRRCRHDRGHYRRHRGYSHDYYGHGHRNHHRRNFYRRNQHHGRHHDRHRYYRPERRISHVIRAY